MTSKHCALVYRGRYDIVFLSMIALGAGTCCLFTSIAAFDSAPAFAFASAVAFARQRAQMSFNTTRVVEYSTRVAWA